MADFNAATNIAVYEQEKHVHDIEHLLLLEQKLVVSLLYHKLEFPCARV